MVALEGLDAKTHSLKYRDTEGTPLYTHRHSLFREDSTVIKQEKKTTSATVQPNVTRTIQDERPETDLLTATLCTCAVHLGQQRQQLRADVRINARLTCQGRLSSEATQNKKNDHYIQHSSAQQAGIHRKALVKAKNDAV
ncbi:hypothetical protein ElyMa_005336400 [Elysia marginata]|uniref:Uncharacterized protein n=1 Tax=Elysia marginata TaxID=1093978 RepID=A0AAV4E7Y6_9GAST|nr:hypothetical protein ElyMa_005336400 [Elysia marginata]